MSKLNPLPEKDKVAKRVEPELETDKIGGDESLKIARMVCEELKKGRSEMAGWVTDRKKDLQMYNGELPTIIEDLNKEAWQSDRNLGLTAAICDSYQATLLGTCWNTDTVHMVATEKTDIDRKDNCSKFIKWMVGASECNVHNEIDDFIHNRITLGTSYLKIRWKVWYEWVDRRVPKETKRILGVLGKPEFKGYDIKTEHKRFERGVLENIDDLDDLVYPTFGKTLQSKSFLIHVLHKNASDVIDEMERGYYNNVTEDFISKLREKLQERILAEEKEKDMGVTKENITPSEDIDFEIDLLERYGVYERNGKKEEYRITVEPLTETVIAIKPLRKITRSGKRPFVGSGLIRRPGLLQGKSMPRLLMHVSNAFNAIWNQKVDFQYVENVPFGFMRPNENFEQQIYKVRPGDIFPTEGEPAKDVYFPNLSRSLGWAESDINLLFQMAERLTGAGSYFMSNTQGVSGTATRDVLINQKSETRFGLWVGRIQIDISEGLTMLFNFYQDWAPEGLGERVLGEDGKQIFNNFSIETIRGGYDVNLVPDITTGSKTMEREIALWGLEALSQTIWFHPQINPKGNWQLTMNAAKKTGIPNIENIMPPEPKANFGKTKVVEDAWNRIKQGEVLAVEEGEDVMALFMGLSEKKDKEYYDLDEEYRQGFDNYLFSLYMGMMKLIQQQYQQQQANNMAMQMIMAGNQGGGAPPGGGGMPGGGMPAPGPTMPNPGTGVQNAGIVR